MEFKVRSARFSLALIVLLLIFSAFSPAQKANPPRPSVSGQRPRIGLALSGGGALGLAEIGVIQWLEENHIPVDRIAGTSMGSIIASMYATGMSPEEIQKFAEKIDWEETFLPAPGYSQISYRRKQDRRDFQINTPLGLKHGLTGPNGFNPGQGVQLLLDRIAFPQSQISTFDDLPIPFRCVATDMQNGDVVVLRDGPLAQAVRASMAIPGVFTPVKLNGRVLADGGMVQNIPVETVRAMDSDVVIGVELHLPPGDIAELESLSGVLTRALDVMVTQNEKRSLALADFKISVDMKGFSVGAYDRVDELIALGYKTAAGLSNGLKRYAIQDPAEWQQYLDQRNARKRMPIKKVDAIVVTGTDPDRSRRIENELAKETRGPLDFHTLDTQ
ncbi:MAG: patatin-like phospholipase family protein, partial [Candidatus Sulfotelmatobacter sp.]